MSDVTREEFNSLKEEVRAIREDRLSRIDTNLVAIRADIVEIKDAVDDIKREVLAGADIALTHRVEINAIREAQHKDGVFMREALGIIAGALDVELPPEEPT